MPYPSGKRRRVRVDPSSPVSGRSAPLPEILVRTLPHKPPDPSVGQGTDTPATTETLAPIDSGSEEAPSTATASWRISYVELSLATSSLEGLERAQARLTPEFVSALFARHSEIEELAVIRTCHRIGLVVLDRERDPMGWRDLLGGPAPTWEARFGSDAVHHLFRIAAGLESLAKGEREVRDQLPRALSSLHSRHPRPVVADALRAALRSAQATDDAHPFRQSVGLLAAERILTEVGRASPKVVVIGTGTVARQVAHALSSRARVAVAYRSHAPTPAFRRETDARPVPFSHLPDELPATDAVVAATKSGQERVLDAHDVHGRATRLVVVDLGVPRNVDPRLRAEPMVRLIDLEELYAGRPEEGVDGALDRSVAEAAARHFRSMRHELGQPSIDEEMRAAEAVRRAELARGRPHLGELSPAQEAALDRLTRRLTEKLVRARPRGGTDLRDGMDLGP